MTNVSFRMKDGSVIGVRIQYLEARDIESKLGSPGYVFSVSHGAVRHTIRAADVEGMSIFN